MSSTYCHVGQWERKKDLHLGLFKQKKRKWFGPLVMTYSKTRVCGFDVTNSWATRAMNNILCRITDQPLQQQRRRTCLHYDGPHLAFISHISSYTAFQKTTQFMEMSRKLDHNLHSRNIQMWLSQWESTVRHAVISLGSPSLLALVVVVCWCELANSLHEITYSQHAIKMLISRHADYKTKYLVFTLCNIQAILFIPYFLSMSRF